MNLMIQNRKERHLIKVTKKEITTKKGLLAISIIKLEKLN